MKLEETLHSKLWVSEGSVLLPGPPVEIEVIMRKQGRHIREDQLKKKVSSKTFNFSNIAKSFFCSLSRLQNELIVALVMHDRISPRSVLDAFPRRPQHMRRYSFAREVRNAAFRGVHGDGPLHIQLEPFGNRILSGTRSSLDVSRVLAINQKDA